MSFYIKLLLSLLNPCSFFNQLLFHNNDSSDAFVLSELILPPEINNKLNDVRISVEIMTLHTR